jgi:hypothetical protein
VSRREGYVEETWLGQIWQDDQWMDYARGTEASSRRWQREDPENRRVVDWIRKENILVANTPRDEEVNAEDVTEGDFLPGLGMGYVFAAAVVDTYDNRVSIGRYYTVTEDDYVLIQFHDRDGNENYVVMAKEARITIRRGEPI